MDVPLLLLILILPLYSAQIYGLALITAPTPNCEGAESCVTCVQDSSCFWCESRRSCKIYPKQVDIKDCAKWSRNTCKQSTTPMTLIVSATLFGIIICGVLIFVCVKKKLWRCFTKTRTFESDKERLMGHEERLSRRRKHRKKQSSRAHKFTAKYKLSDSSTQPYLK